MTTNNTNILNGNESCPFPELQIMLGNQPEVLQFYTAEMCNMVDSLKEAKRSAIREMWPLLSIGDQDELRSVFSDIVHWHKTHRNVSTLLENRLFYAAGLLIPMARCPYLESIKVYKVYR